MSNETEYLDGSDQEAAEALAAEERRLQLAIEINDLKKLMSMKEGRRFMWRLLSDSGVYRTSFATNGLQMAHLEGQRAIGLMKLAEIMDHCPEQFNVMTMEQAANAKRSRSSSTGRSGNTSTR